MLLEVIFERNKAVWINKMLLMLMYDRARDLTDGGRACGCCTRLMENKQRQHSLSCKQARNQDHLLFVLFYLHNSVFLCSSPCCVCFLRAFVRSVLQDESLTDLSGTQKETV